MDSGARERIADDCETNTNYVTGCDVVFNGTVTGVRLTSGNR